MPLLATAEMITEESSIAFNRQYIFMLSTIAALGGLLFGYDIANISGTISFFQNYFQLSEVSVGWAVGCISVGAAFGALIAGKLSDMLGRKKLLIISAIIFAITGVGTGWATDFTWFIIFRILSGVAIGAATVVCPIYIAEISPGQFRGRLVAYYQLAITLGVLLAYLSNYFLLNTGENNWRWMFSSQSVPAFFFLIGLLFVIESPRWLVGRGREREARKMLEKVGGVEFADIEISAIHESYCKSNRRSIKEIFDKKIFHVVITGVILAIFSQLGGPFTAYAPEIFREAGVAQDSAFLQSVIIGVVLFLFTLVAIATVEKAGRKELLLYGAVLLFIDSLLIAAAFYYHWSGGWVLFLSLVLIAVYAATIGPVTWVILSEIFPNRIRGNAMSLATLSLWIANFLNNASFPILKENLGISFTFGVYAPLFVVYFFFVYFKIPETKGKSLEEIERMISRNN